MSHSSYEIRRLEEENTRLRDRLKAAQRVNNPQGKPTGHYTGRCGVCGSADLWDDNSAYGCNTCKAFWCFGS